MSFKLWLFEVALKRTLYRGTVAGQDLNHVGRDSGDWGLGVYLTPNAKLAERYALNTAKRTKREPIILVINHSLQNPANFDDKTFATEFFARIGVPMQKDLIPGIPQTRPYEDSKLIRDELLKMGYDSAVARNGYEVVAFDETKLQIVDTRSVDDADFLV
jgi:hypothetical protein